MPNVDMWEENGTPPSKELFKKMDSLIPKLDKPCHLELDNASIHTAKIVKEFIHQTRHKLLFSIPYIPELNPIENSFSIIKRKVKQRGVKTYGELNRALESSLVHVTPKKLSNMFRKSAGLIGDQIRR